MFLFTACLHQGRKLLEARNVKRLQTTCVYFITRRMAMFPDAGNVCETELKPTNMQLLDVCSMPPETLVSILHTIYTGTHA